MSTFPKLLQTVGLLGLVGLAMPGLARAADGYSACYAHQSDKNRVIWTQPFPANESDKETIAVNFLNYLKEKSYVQDMTAVQGTCTWKSDSSLAARTMENFKGRFPNSTDVGVGFSGGIPEPDFEAIKMNADCAREDAQGCLDYGYLLESGTRGVTLDPAKAATYYLKSCGLGNPQGCTYLGVLKASGTGVPRDTAVAISLYEAACTTKYARACFLLGHGYTEGTFGAVDLVQANGYYQIACDLDSAAACNNLGWHHESGTGTEVDKAKAMAFYVKGCELGSARGCTNRDDLKPRM